MDRITFLSTLPFLIPLDSKVWPPTTTSSSSTTSTCGDGISCSSSSEVILGVSHSKNKMTNNNYSSSYVLPIAPIPFVVSIESRINASSFSNNNKDTSNDKNANYENTESYQVLYFSTTSTKEEGEGEDGRVNANNNVKQDVLQVLDPTLTAIEIAVLRVQHPSTTSTSTRTTANANVNGNNNNNNNNNNMDPFTQVYLRVQGEYVFLFNTQSCHCTSLPESKKKTTTTTTTTNTNNIDKEFSTNVNKDLPQCLLLQFQHSNIQFRLFPWSLTSPYQNADISTHENDDVKEIFQQVWQTFDTCRRQNQIIYPTQIEIAKVYRLFNDNNAIDSKDTTNQNSASTTTTESPVVQNQQEDDIAIVVDDDQTMARKAVHNTSFLSKMSFESKVPPKNENTTAIDCSTKRSLELSPQTPIPTTTTTTTTTTRLQRYMEVRNQSLSSLNQIRQILHIPISTIQTQLLRTKDSHNNDADNDDDEDDDDEDKVDHNSPQNTSNIPHASFQQQQQQQQLTQATIPMLLNTSARHMSQSYFIGTEDRTMIQSEYDTQIQQLQQEQITNVMNAYFFPSSLQHSHRHKRRRLQQQQQQALSASKISSSSSSINSIRCGDQVTSPTHVAVTTTTNSMEHAPATTKPNVTTETTINTMTKLMMEQKRIIQERYQLFLLPSRD